MAAESTQPRGSFTNIAIVGAGTIGLSFAALHLSLPDTRVAIYDPRCDLTEYIEAKLPEYLSILSSQQHDQKQSTHGQGSPDVTLLICTGRLSMTSSLSEAVSQADIVQEQGPEKVDFKQHLWAEVESLAHQRALFWSSTSGIPASVQSEKMRDKTRLMVVHPYNPPHIMPLLEIVTAPGVEISRSPALSHTMEYWKKLGRKPIILQREITGFVANRLAFALFREAAHLVDRGIASAQEIDQVVEQSLGPRWAVRGPFWSYHAGGGEESGLRGFLDKIGGTVQACWDDLGNPQLRSMGRENSSDGSWQEKVCDQVQEAYGKLGENHLRDRDRKLQEILGIANM